MIRVAGVDGATKNLGLAHADGTVVTLNARTGAKDPVRRLVELDRAFANALRHHPPFPDVFVVEGYGLGTPGRLALVRLGEVGGMIRTNAFLVGAEVVEVSPSSLKRYATGNGTAKKPAMIARAAELGASFSRPVTGNEKTDPHDEADAYLARDLGRMVYDRTRDPLPHELEVVASIDWPKSPT